MGGKQSPAGLFSFAALEIYISQLCAAHFFVNLEDEGVFSV